MSATIKKRRDSRTETTRTALIEAAERLFAEHGLASVSTRQIGMAIGSGNNTVVAYHFGGKDQLIEAIYHYRLPEIDRRRGELMDELELAGHANDLRQILRALWLPLFEQVDAKGQHIYARFLDAVMREGLGRTRSAANPDFPRTIELTNLAAPHLPFGHGLLWSARWQLATRMVLTALREIDMAVIGPVSREAARDLFEDAMAMARCALLAPVEAEQIKADNID